MENPKLINDEELEKLLEPHHPIGKEFARRAEEQIFRFMFEWKVWKIYIWDDFHSDGSNAKWDWCFAPIPPAGKACREHNFVNLIAMDDWHFERLVRSLPKSPNEDIVREWRQAMRKDPLIVQAAKSEASPVDWNDIELRYEPDNLQAEVEPLTDADFQALEAAKLNDYLLSSVKNARRVKEDSPDMGLRRWGGDFNGSAIGIAK